MELKLKLVDLNGLVVTYLYENWFLEAINIHIFS